MRVQAEQIADAYLPQPTGRPSGLTEPDTVQLLLAAIADGNYRETACKLAGISKVTFYNWLKRADAGDEAAIAFVNALEKAEAAAESETVRNVRQASKLPQFWAAGMTWLERKSPDRWGKRQDDSNTPRVVVQIGVQDSEVRINMVSPSAFAPPCAEVGQANSLSDKAFDIPSSLINSDYGNQPPAELEGGSAPAARDLAGGPIPVGGSLTAPDGDGQRKGLRRRGRKEKRA